MKKLIWVMKKLIWIMFHWPKYKAGDVFTDKGSGKRITIKSRFVSPYLSGPFSWSYYYGDNYAIGQEGLDLLYMREK